MLTDARRHDPSAPSVLLRRVTWLLAIATIFAQILWILVTGQFRIGLTILSVITFACATSLEIWARAGFRVAAMYVLTTAGVGWLAEASGTRFGIPFGEYHYTDLLGWKIADVPVLIPLAWSMMAWPIYSVIHSLRPRLLPTWVWAAFAFASWDLFLDPQMVGEGYWVWRFPEPGLPGIDGIPLTNFAGWVLVSLILMRLVSWLPITPAVPAPLAALLSWVYFSNVFAALVFFDRPGVAIWGGLAMGAFIIPWWRNLLQARRP